MALTGLIGSKGASAISRRSMLESTAGFAGIMACLVGAGSNSFAQGNKAAATGKPLGCVRTNRGLCNPRSAQGFFRASRPAPCRRSR